MGMRLALLLGMLILLAISSYGGEANCNVQDMWLSDTKDMRDDIEIMNCTIQKLLHNLTYYADWEKETEDWRRNLSRLEDEYKVYEQKTNLVKALQAEIESEKTKIRKTDEKLTKAINGLGETWDLINSAKDQMEKLQESINDNTSLATNRDDLNEINTRLDGLIETANEHSETALAHTSIKREMRDNLKQLESLLKRGKEDIKEPTDNLDNYRYWNDDRQDSIKYVRIIKQLVNDELEKLVKQMREMQQKRAEQQG